MTSGTFYSISEFKQIPKSYDCLPTLTRELCSVASVQREHNLGED